MTDSNASDHKGTNPSDDESSSVTMGQEVLFQLLPPIDFRRHPAGVTPQIFLNDRLNPD
jgi:hypothetical protein